MIDHNAIIEVVAYAKLNLSLRILGTRADGYHLLDMRMRTISLCDSLTFKASDGDRLSVPDNPALETGDNLVLKAVRALRDVVPFGGVVCGLEKRIPEAAGMGGGSADAAAALRAVNELYSLGLSEAELARIAATVGADVPFLLRGGCARATGIGTELAYIAGEDAPCAIAVATPIARLNTAAIYRRYDDAPVKEARTGYFNDLEGAAIALCPDIEALIGHFRAMGAMESHMTGSGPTVYALFGDDAAAGAALARMPVRTRYAGVHRFVP